MFCENCGKEVVNGSSFCENCGAGLNAGANNFSANVGEGDLNNPNTGDMNNGVNAGTKTNVLAIVGFVLSILSFCCFGIILGPASLVLGIIARNQIKDSAGMQTGDGLALAAIIIGGIATALTIIFLVLKIIFSTTLTSLNF